MLHRNDPGITEDHEVKKTAASPSTTSASNEENAGRVSAPKANTETKTKPKKKKLKFKTFAQLAASERYRQTRAAYELLTVDDDDGSKGEIEGGSEEHPLRRLADGEIEPPGGENAVEDMDVDEADRGVRTSGHSDTELSIGNDVAVLAKESPAVSNDGEETSGECIGNLPDGQVTEGNLSSMHEVLTNWMEEYGGHHVKLTENGQSLYQAYYAATSNPDGDRLVMAEEDTRALNVIKRNVLNLLLRLRYDIQLDLVQPHKELTRMYPATVAPNTSTGSTVKLYAHFAADRQVCTSTNISSRTRAP